MTRFTLDAKLESDTFTLGLLDDQLLLLMNNRLVPWFILVPQTIHKEIYQLSEHEQATLYKNINILSKHLVSNFDIDKINIGAIGNIVSQLHVHVIGRRTDDHAWPGVVWGNPERIAYQDHEVSHIRQELVNDAELRTFTAMTDQ
jgi:diadenosine tetraphosphate (Ap4A) HIT family hydrolase